MNHREIAVLMDGIAPVLRSYMEKAFEPIGTRLVELEKRFDALPPARDGKDADPVLILRLVEEAVAKIPPAQAGKDADPAIVAELVDKAVAAIEKPKDGEPGKDGKDGSPGIDGKDGVDGKDGAPGRDGVDGKDGSPGVDGQNGEPGRDGSDGKDGRDGVDGKDGPSGRDGIDGKDGLNGKDGDPGRDGRDGLPGVAGLPGKDGVNGKDGLDGLGFEDMEVEYDGERTVTLKFVRGELVKEFPLTLPIPIDQGVWKEGNYVRGDTVSFGGQIWIARRDTSEKPDFVEGNAWRLSVKKGRDGKDFRPEEKRATEPVRLK